MCFPRLALLRLAMGTISVNKRERKLWILYVYRYKTSRFVRARVSRYYNVLSLRSYFMLVNFFHVITES